MTTAISIVGAFAIFFSLLQVMISSFCGESNYRGRLIAFCLLCFSFLVGVFVLGVISASNIHITVAIAICGALACVGSIINGFISMIQLDEEEDEFLYLCVLFAMITSMLVVATYVLAFCK